MRFITCGTLLLTGCLALSAQVFTGANTPGTATSFSVVLGTGATNLCLTLGGTGTAYSYLMIRKGSAPTDTSYDFSSQLAGQTNALNLEQPEVSPGTYYLRVSTPSASSAHSFTLLCETNRTDLRSAARPVTKPLSSLATGVATAGSTEYFRLELATNAFWRASLDATNLSGPDLYVARGALPTVSSYLKRSQSLTNDILTFTSSEATPGVYFVGVFGAGAPVGGAPYTLRLSQVPIITLNWDPGLAHLGTEVYTNLTGVADDYYFRIVTANPALGAWRTALRLLTNDANLYVSRSVLPTPYSCDYKSERSGSDGFVLAASTQFQPGEEWFILVRASAGAQWTLVTGAPFVSDLGTVASDDSSGSGNVDIGPEGIRFFSATAPAEMLAWRLWLYGQTNTILVKKTSVPLASANDLAQPGQMLVVPAYLTAGQVLHRRGRQTGRHHQPGFTAAGGAGSGLRRQCRGQRHWVPLYRLSGGGAGPADCLANHAAFDQRQPRYRLAPQHCPERKQQRRRLGLDREHHGQHHAGPARAQRRNFLPDGLLH